MSEAPPEGTLALRTDDIEWRVVDGEVVAVDLSAKAYFATNASGALLWSRLHAGARRAELVELLCERYGLTTDTAERDVDAFLDHLAEHGLLD
jgi:hypothetical protein